MLYVEYFLFSIIVRNTSDMFWFVFFLVMNCFGQFLCLFGSIVIWIGLLLDIYVVNGVILAIIGLFEILAFVYGSPVAIRQVFVDAIIKAMTKLACLLCVLTRFSLRTGFGTLCNSMLYHCFFFRIASMGFSNSMDTVGLVSSNCWCINGSSKNNIMCIINC